jgi:hypothetical protein
MAVNIVARNPRTRTGGGGAGSDLDQFNPLVPRFRNPAPARQVQPDPYADLNPPFRAVPPRSTQGDFMDQFNLIPGNAGRVPPVPPRQVAAPRPLSIDPFAEFNPQRGQTGFADNVTIQDLINTPVRNFVPQVPRMNAPGSHWANVTQDVWNRLADSLVTPGGDPSTGGAGGGAGGSGGGVAGGTRADTLARAQAALEAELSGLGGLYGDRLSGIESMYGSQFDQLGQSFGGYRDALMGAATASRGQIDQATQQALTRLSELDPQAAFQWAVGEVGTPGVAGGDYLSRIGASGAEVDAVRMLSEQLMRQQMAAAQQYSMGAQSSMDRERQARQAASGLMSQEALTGLSQVEQQRQAQIADEEMRRRQALENAMRQEQAGVRSEQSQREQALRDQLLRYQLEYDLGV